MVKEVCTSSSIIIDVWKKKFHSISFTEGETATTDDVEQTSTYYVTETGEYFYQTDTVDGQVMTVVSGK